MVFPHQIAVWSKSFFSDQDPHSISTKFDMVGEVLLSTFLSKIYIISEILVIKAKFSDFLCEISLFFGEIWSSYAKFIRMVIYILDCFFMLYISNYVKTFKYYVHLNVKFN